MRSADEALRLAVDAIGGEKAVGSLLRPEMHPVLAGQWLAHCLDPERREKLSIAQMALVFGHAKAKGRHDGFEVLAQLLGYRVTAVIDPADELADLAHRAETAAREANTLTAEVIARMRAAGLKVNA
jgi:hypothetical protein